jgi:type IV secretory pathway ATPase VirB11/archaellum biosynthesis ATPase
MFRNELEIDETITTTVDVGLVTYPNSKGQTLRVKSMFSTATSSDGMTITIRKPVHSYLCNVMQCNAMQCNVM